MDDGPLLPGDELHGRLDLLPDMHEVEQGKDIVARGRRVGSGLGKCNRNCETSQQDST
jgi:hypothetical protein